MSLENGARIIILDDVSQAYYKLIRGRDALSYHTQSVVCDIILTALSVDVIILSVCCLFIAHLCTKLSLLKTAQRFHLNSDNIL